MKTIQISLMLSFLAVSLMAFSCKKDKDNDRDDFIASYSVIESCSISGNGQYNMTVSTSSTSEEEIIIGNFGGASGALVRAKVSGKTFTIPNQTLSIDGVSITINTGTGSLNGNLLTVTYTYSFGTESESCSITATKL